MFFVSPAGINLTWSHGLTPVIPMYTHPRLILSAFASQGDGCVSVCGRVNRASDQLAVVVFSHGRSQKVLITTRTKSMSELIPYVCAMP